MPSKNPLTPGGNQIWLDDPDQPEEAHGEAKPRVLFSPRIVLLVLFATGLLWSVISAYVHRPRVQAAFGGIADTIPVRQRDFDTVSLRSAPFRDELEKRLTSDAFMTALRANDVHQARLFPQGTPVVVDHVPAGGFFDVDRFAAKTEKMVSDAYEGRTLAFILAESGRSDLQVIYVFPQSYSVDRPGNAWIRWIQARLPGMPSEARLAREAEAANQAMKDHIAKLVQRTVRDCALSSR